MPTLRTFGGLQLLSPGGAPVLGQRLRLAVLAVIASGRELGVTRDKLLLLFWPDSTLQNARGSLDQVLYQLRRQLGDGAFVGAADPVRLNPEVVTDEAAEFDRLLDSGAIAEAVSMYRGPYLDGFHLGGSSEFDQWLEVERRRLAARHAEALTALAEAAERRGDHAEASARWRALAAAEPLNARAVAGAMRAMARDGDPAGGLRIFAGYEAVLRSELGVEPDPTLRTLAGAIRAGDLHAEPSVPAPVAQGPVDATTARPHRGRRSLLGPILLVTVAVAAVLVWREPFRRASPPPGGIVTSVAVFPFSVLGEGATGSGWMGEAIPDLLSARLRLVPDLSVVDPARAFRAWHAVNAGGASTADQAMARVPASLGVVGRILVDSTTIELSAELLDAERGRPVETATVRGPRDSLGALVDRLASRLVAGHAGDARVRHEYFVNLPFPAVQAYLEGRAARRQGKLGIALASFESAVEFDSTFALAALEFVATTGMLSNRSVAVAGGTRTTVAVPSGPGAARGVTEGRYSAMLALALRHESRLPEPDRAYLRALAGRAYPAETTIRERLEGWDTAVRLAPDRAEVRYQAGLVLLYQAPALGIADAWPRATAEFREAILLDPAFPLPWLGLMEAAGLRGDWAEAVRHAERFLALAEPGELAAYARWYRDAAKGGGDPPKLSPEMDAAPSNVLGAVALASQVHGIRLEDGNLADSLLTTRATTRAQRRVAYYDRAILLLNLGRPVDAASAMEVKDGYDPYAHVGLFQILRFGMYWDGDSAQAAAAARTLAELLERTTARDTIAWAQPAAYDRAAWFLGQWHLWRGELAAARRQRERLERRAPGQAPLDPAFLPFLDALEEVVTAGPAARTAAKRLDSLAVAECCGVFINLVAARALRRVGLIEPALAAARRGRWARLPEHLSAYLAEEAQLALAAGDTAGSRRAIDHLAALSVGATAGRGRWLAALREAAGLPPTVKGGAGTN